SGYVKYIRAVLPVIRRSLAELRKARSLGDPFGIGRSQTQLAGAAERGGVGAAENVVVAHLDLLNRMDSLLTMLQLAEGDPADILQNIRWQLDLYTHRRVLRDLPCRRQVEKRSREFIRRFGRHEATAAEFPSLIRSL